MCPSCDDAWPTSRSVTPLCRTWPSVNLLRRPRVSAATTIERRSTMLNAAREVTRSRWSVTSRPVSGHPIPCIPDRALDLLPCRLAALFVTVPVAAQVWLDVVPVLALIAIARLVSETIGRAIEVEVSARLDVRPALEVLLPVPIPRSASRFASSDSPWFASSRSPHAADAAAAFIACHVFFS